MPQPTTDQIASASAIARRHALRMLGPNDNEGVGVEDVAQEVLVRFSMLELAEVGNWEAWVVTVTKNCCTDILRSRRLRRHEALDANPDRAVESLPPVSSASSIVLAEIARTELVSPLSGKERQMIFLYLDGWTYAEIADHVGYASANVVGVALNRALKKMRPHADPAHVSYMRMPSACEAA